MKATLARLPSTDEGTFGIFTAGDFSCWILEPPWRGNKPNLSCIPWGQYRCVWHQSPRYGGVYIVVGVMGRSHILQHPGNFGGDREKGLKTHTLGCMLPGIRRARIKGQMAVTSSRMATQQMVAALGKQPYRLMIGGAGA